MCYLMLFRYVFGMRFAFCFIRISLHRFVFTIYIDIFSHRYSFKYIIYIFEIYINVWNRSKPCYGRTTIYWNIARVNFHMHLRLYDGVWFYKTTDKHHHYYIRVTTAFDFFFFVFDTKCMVYVVLSYTKNTNVLL